MYTYASYRRGKNDMFIILARKTYSYNIWCVSLIIGMYLKLQQTY